MVILMLNIDDIKKLLSPSKDYIFDTIIIKNEKVTIIYNEVLSDVKTINNNILYRLLLLNKKELNNLDNNLPNCNTLIINKEDIIKYLNNGFLILIYKKIYACECRQLLDRGVTTIQSELTLTGPKDSLTESFNTNLGLIRKRIKSERLKSKTLEIGRLTKTKIGILYINDIVKKEIPIQIENKLKKIDIDGIIDSSYLKYSLEDKYNLFPTIIQTERPDKCSMALLEGKCVIIIDNSSYALILPSLFLDFLHTTDDYFQKSFHTTFIRLIRTIAFIISIFLPAIYISVTTRNYNLIPLPLLLTLKAGRSFVPFPAYMEALFMIICFEILKESDLRMSTNQASAVSILGGLILGDAAVSAGIVSPIMIIIIAISSIAGLIFTSYELENTLRFYKIFLLVLSTIFGIYGILIGTIFLLHQIINTKILNISYLSYDKKELKDSIIKIDTNIRYRNSKLTNNKIRGRYK